MNLIEHIISSIAPHECIHCGAEGALLCQACAGRLPQLSPVCYMCQRQTESWSTCPRCRKQTPLAVVLPATPYVTEARQLLYALKYERAAAAAREVAAVISARLRSVPLPDDLVVSHVPTVASRIRQRGYDQSALIARYVARELKVPYTPLLRRLGAQRQVGQGRAQRKRQMVLAFRPAKVRPIPNKTVMLIDDVLTTGATLEAAARVMRQAGAQRVWAVVFARAL